MDEKFIIPKLSFSDLLEEHLLIDVRSPKEFEEFSFTDSLNLPIFTDDERIRVGTIYKQTGKEEAIKLGLQLYSKKITTIYETICDLQHQSPGKKIVVVCARGGMRSSSIVSTLNMLGVHCFQLRDGIKSYRQSITEQLQKFSLVHKRFYNISGNTGTKKTEILHYLKREGYPVIDLEGLAGHRGSVFGEIGLKARSQKQFEACLIKELARYSSSPYYIIESESKRIGKVIVPDFLIEGKENGMKIELEYPLSMRVAHIVETYQPEKNHDNIIEAFSKIKKRLQDHIGNEIEMLLGSGQYDKAFQLLLTYYYDPSYHHTSLKFKQPEHVINFTNVNEAVNEIKRIMDENEKILKNEGMA